MKTSMMIRRTFSVMLVSTACLVFISVSHAEKFGIVFHRQVGSGWNLYENFYLDGDGHFEIGDNSIIPNGIVLFDDPDFESFYAAFSTLLDYTGREYTLGEDDFPPDENGNDT